MLELLNEVNCQHELAQSGLQYVCAYWWFLADALGCDITELAE